MKIIYNVMYENGTDTLVQSCATRKIAEKLVELYKAIGFSEVKLNIDTVFESMKDVLAYPYYDCVEEEHE